MTGGLSDCLTDPGKLDRDTAVLALSIHHACPPQCEPRRRADEATAARYAPAAAGWGGDAEFAERLRLAAHLTETAGRHRR